MKRRFLNLLASTLAFALPLSLTAATNNWIGVKGDWGVATNWSTGMVPGPNDLVVIGYNPATVVTHSSNSDTILNIQTSEPLIISGGSITVTSNSSLLGGALTVSNGATLEAIGAGTTFSTQGNVTADDANFYVGGGAVMTLTNLRSFTKECNGAYWTVTGSNSVLSLPALTNITGEGCNYPTIQAEAGGQILAPNLASIEAGPLAFQADGTNSLINFNALNQCNGQGSYLVTFEASSGGTVQIPNMQGGSLVGVTINAGGTMPTAQLRKLNSLSLTGATNTFFSLTNLINLTVNGGMINFTALANFDDGTVTLTGAANVTMPAVKNYNKYCNGANWSVTGLGTELNFSSLTNITGEACTYPTIQAEGGGLIELQHLSTIQAGPLAFQADGNNSVINLNALTNCTGVGGYLITFEASSGGTINIPNLTGSTAVGLTLNSGGSIPTTQITSLNSLTLSQVSVNLNALTTLVNLNITSVGITFPALTNFDDGNVTVNGGSVSMPSLRNYTKLSCNGANWNVTGSGSHLSMGALTNISGDTCNFPVIQAEAGGQIQLPNLVAVQVAPLTFQADGVNSLINLSSLRICAGQDGYLLSFEVSNGGTITLPQMTGGPLVGVTINPGGTIATAQIQNLTTLNLPGVTNNFNALVSLGNLTISGVTMNFPSLTNFDDGNINVSAGAQVTMPALQNYTKLSCYGDNWTVTGAGSLLDLPALTNMSGATCNYPVIQAEAGGEILATNLASIEIGPLAVQADGTDSLIDLSGLTNAAGQEGYQLTFEASGGGTLQIQNLATCQLVGLTFNAGGAMTPSNLMIFKQSAITLPGGTLSLPSLSNMDASSLAVTGGAVLSLANVGNYAAGQGINASWQANGTGSQINLTGLTNLIGDTSGNMTLDALSGGQLNLGGLQSIPNGSMALLSDGTGSVINLSDLSSFALQTGQGSLTAQNGGNVLLNTQAFLIANVSINIPAGNPVLPPTLIPSSALTVYGQTGHSYLVEDRNLLIPNSPFVFLAQVALTNSFEAIAAQPQPNTAYLVTDFVANPPQLGLARMGSQVQLTLYGLTNGTYQIQSTTNVSLTNSWTNNGGSITMTNSFRILPPVTPVPPGLFYRAHQQ